MSLTLEADRLTEAHRLAQVRLGARVTSLSSATWRLIDLDNIDRSTRLWLYVNRSLVESMRPASERLAASYLVRHKAAELPGGGPSPVQPADPLDVVRVSESLVESGPVRVKEALRRGDSPVEALTLARNEAAATATRHVLNAGRGSVLNTVRRDRQAVGWIRRTRSAKPCAFCAMLAGRGPVYKSRATSGFSAHNGCFCVAEPVYSHDTPWPDSNRRYNDLWYQAQDDARAAGELKRGTSNDALNAFRRALRD